MLFSSAQKLCTMSYCSLINYIEQLVKVRKLKTICWYHNERLNRVRKKYYVVIKGRVPGIYTCCVDYHKQVLCYSQQRCKGFMREEDALLYIKRELDDLKFSSCDESNKSTVHTLENILTHYKDVWKNVIEKEVKVLLNRSSRHIINNLTFDSDGYLEVYTDAACSSYNAVATVGVYFGAGSSLNAYAVIKEENINSTDAEIKAIYAGLKKARDAGYRKVKVLTDSESAIYILTHKFRSWKRDSWMNWSGEFLKNKDYYIEIDELICNLEVKLVHVGSQFNKADQIARECMKMVLKELQKEKQNT